MRSSQFSSIVFFYCSAHHRDLHSFPTRRSSDLPSELVEFTAAGRFVNQFSIDPLNAGPFSLAVTSAGGQVRFAALNDNRSEERRVGKECRSRWSAYE